MNNVSGPIRDRGVNLSDLKAKEDKIQTDKLALYNHVKISNLKVAKDGTLKKMSFIDKIKYAFSSKTEKQGTQQKVREAVKNDIKHHITWIQSSSKDSASSRLQEFSFAESYFK